MEQINPPNAKNVTGGDIYISLYVVIRDLDDGRQFGVCEMGHRVDGGFSMREISRWKI